MARRGATRRASDLRSDNNADQGSFWPDACRTSSNKAIRANADNLSYVAVSERLNNDQWQRADARDYLDPESGELLYPDTVQATLYPGAGEASVICGRWPDMPNNRDRVVSQRPDRSRSRREAERRARSRVRRYCAANGLTRLVTLTYADSVFDRSQVMLDVRNFIRGLRRSLGGEAFAYVWVPELHPGGHGFHVHLGLGFYVPKALVAKVWGKGHVDVRKIRVRAGLSGRHAARVAALYLAKEVSKSYGEVYAQADKAWVLRLAEAVAFLGFVNPGLDLLGTFEVEQPRKCPHAYEVGQDHQPLAVKVRLRTMQEGRDLVRQTLAGSDDPVAIWRSSDTHEWYGPPCEVWFF